MSSFSSIKFLFFISSFIILFHFINCDCGGKKCKITDPNNFGADCCPNYTCTFDRICTKCLNAGGRCDSFTGNIKCCSGNCNARSNTCH